MSNAKERGRLGDRLMEVFAEYATALNLAGHDWAAVWATGMWPERSELWWLHGRFLLARELTAMANHVFTDAQITQFYRERLAYLALYPDGPPSLTGD
ncbi:hypothetical protein ACPCSC_30220 [Streptomyces lavendulocolor]|uniref:hypothetical protein n=1 Tax=Streptomyces lavendulocolor TaxID=67316 RepID=UPI003C2DFBCE